MTAPLSHSHLQIPGSKYKCLSLRSSTRKLLWSPGAENASKHSLRILNPPKKKEIKGGKEKTLWLPLVSNSSNDNNLQIAGVHPPSTPSHFAPFAWNCSRDCRNCRLFISDPSWANASEQPQALGCRKETICSFTGRAGAEVWARRVDPPAAQQPSSRESRVSVSRALGRDNSAAWRRRLRELR